MWYLVLMWVKKRIQMPHTQKQKWIKMEEQKSGQTINQAHSDNHTAPNQTSHFLLNMFFSDSSSSSKAFSAANRSSFAFSAGCDGPLSGCLEHSSQDQLFSLPNLPTHQENLAKRTVVSGNLIKDTEVPMMACTPSSVITKPLTRPCRSWASASNP